MNFLKSALHLINNNSWYIFTTRPQAFLNTTLMLSEAGALKSPQGGHPQNLWYV